jgi:hypothetical protein
VLEGGFAASSAIKDPSLAARQSIGKGHGPAQQALAAELASGPLLSDGSRRLGELRIG